MTGALGRGKWPNSPSATELVLQHQGLELVVVIGATRGGEQVDEEADQVHERALEYYGAFVNRLSSKPIDAI